MQAGPAMQVPVFLLLFLAPVWVPLDLLTRLGARGRLGSTRSRSSSTPIAALIAGDPKKLLAAFAVAAGLIALMLLWARGGLRSAERAA